MAKRGLSPPLPSMRPGSVEAVLRAREGTLAHLLHIEPDGGMHVTGFGQEVLGELGHITGGDAEGIVHHQDLAVGGRASTNADHRDPQCLGDALGQGDRHALEHQQLDAGFLQAERLTVDLLGLILVTPLHLEAAKHMDGLGVRPR